MRNHPLSTRYAEFYRRPSELRKPVTTGAAGGAGR